jgi:hypothetical protein
MTEKIIADLDKEGWKIVRKDDLDTSVYNQEESTED